MIRVEDLAIVLPGFALEDINLQVDPGEAFALLGPTGAGKTLLLEAIIGVVPVTRGRILIDGCDMTGLPPERRRIGILYQDHALFPHLDVAENIAYGGYSARGVVIQLIVDDGVPGRQHRRNIFNPDYRFVGVACGTHTRLHDMCVMDFAARYAEQENASDQDY